MDPKAPALIHILLSTLRQGRNSPYRAGRHELGALTSFISFISFASQCVSRPICVIKSTLGVALVWVSWLIKA